MSLIVGILSMHRVVNYGSFLQAYALKKVVESFGASCSFIDITSEPSDVKTSLLKKISIKFKRAKSSFLKGNVFNVFAWKVIWRKISADYALFCNTYLGLNNPNQPSAFDVVIIGSDEVFNCAQESPWGTSMQLFGKNLPAKKVVSYAGSFGHTTIAEIDKLGLRESIRNSMSTMQSISVRDQNSVDVVAQILGNEPPMHIDPTLLYDFATEIPSLEGVEEKFMVVYAYNARIEKKEKVKIVAFAKRHQLKLVSIGSYNSWCDSCLIPKSPFEVLAYFKNAKYIVTDTFHGTVFSLKFDKQFAVFVRPSNRNKITALLNQFMLSARIVNDLEDLERVLTTAQDFGPKETVLLKEKQRSMDYLKNALSLQQ